jgi:hypothetical protein
MTTETILDELATVERDLALPVMALNDLAVLHTPGSLDRPPRIDVVHRDKPGEPLISLDPTDASIFLGRLSEQLAAAWVHADQQRQSLQDFGARHAAREAGEPL